VIEILELIMVSKFLFTLRRFLLFNCGLLGKAFGTLAMYSRTIVLLVDNTLGKKGSVWYKARYYARIFLETLAVTTRDITQYRRSPDNDVNPVVRNTVQDDI